MYEVYRSIEEIRNGEVCVSCKRIEEIRNGEVCVSYKQTVKGNLLEYIIIWYGADPCSNP